MTRLYGIIALAAPVAVLFRRGPTKLVRLIKWDLASDTFEFGQWFTGRIYERRCDLSPNGELLLTFAAKHKRPHYTWTTISRPPFLTALALWPGLGTWEGGGLFMNDRIALTYTERGLADGFDLGRNFSVRPYSGDAELDRLRRDGWSVKRDFPLPRHRVPFEDYVQKGDWPAVLEKCRGDPNNRRTLQMNVFKSGKINYAVIVQDCTVVFRPGTADWADWDHNGDLLYSSGCKLYRARFSRRYDPVVGPEQIELADFSEMTFAAVPAPPWALKWPH